MTPMGILSVEFHADCSDRFFMWLAISYSLYSNTLNHLQQCTLEILSPLLFCPFLKSISISMYFFYPILSKSENLNGPRLGIDTWADKSCAGNHTFVEEVL